MMFGNSFYQGNFSLCVRMKTVNTHNRADTASSYNIDMCNKILAPLLKETQILLRIRLIQFDAWLHLGSATMHFQCPDCGHKHYGAWRKARESALQVPEFLIANIRGKAAFCHMVFPEPCPE